LDLWCDGLGVDRFYAAAAASWVARKPHLIFARFKSVARRVTVSDFPGLTSGTLSARGTFVSLDACLSLQLSSPPQLAAGRRLNGYSVR
jgi:hypothetical protein